MAPGGDPVQTSLGCESPLLEHFALGGGKTKQLELGQVIHNVNAHVEKRACKDKLSKRKGVKQEDPRGELNNSFHNNNNREQQTTTEKQLDQARLLEGQLRIDLERRKLQLKELQQKERTKTSNNNLGTSSLSNISNNDLGANSLAEQTLGENSLGREDQQSNKSLEPETLASRSAWQILIDTGAEISVAPRSFAAEVQLSTLGRTNLQLRSAEGKAINIFGWRTVQLLTQSFSFCITFAIAEVETPLLGLGSLLASDLSLHIGKNLGHHLSNNLGERIQLEQRGACPAKLGFNLSSLGILRDNTSLMPEAKLGPSNLQLDKEMQKQGGVDKSLPHRSLEQHKFQENKPAIGQQQPALPKAKPKHKKKGQRQVANKLSKWEKNNYFEMLQLELLEKQDPRASLDRTTGQHLSLRLIVILSLMNKWQLQTLRIQAAWPQEITKAKLRELGIKESKVDSDIMLGYKLVVFQHNDCLLISGDKKQQEDFCNKLSAHFHPKEQQQLGEDAPLSFCNMLLERNQADRAINLHPTKAFYQDLLGRYSFEDAKGGEDTNVRA